MPEVGRGTSKTAGKTREEGESQVTEDSAGHLKESDIYPMNIPQPERIYFFSCSKFRVENVKKRVRIRDRKFSWEDSAVTPAGNDDVMN